MAGHQIFAARTSSWASTRQKTGQGRIVPILPALKAWLEPHAKATGLVIPQYSGDAPLLRAFRQAPDAPEVEMIHNGLRHSFRKLPSRHRSGRRPSGA